MNSTSSSPLATTSSHGEAGPVHGDESFGDAGSAAELDEASVQYGRRVGERLRSIRRQKRLSLQDVEALSNQEFKASVLGAYERGERAISVARLQRLANYYSVPVDQLLPRTTSSKSDVVDLTVDTTAINGVTIQLEAVAEVPPPEGEMLRRYLDMIQVQRGDFNGRVLTVRQDDLRAVACILGVEIEVAVSRLRDLNLVHVDE